MGYWNDVLKRRNPDLCTTKMTGCVSFTGESQQLGRGRDRRRKGKVVETGERQKSDRNRLLFHFCCFEVGGGRGWSGRKDLANDRTQRAISEGIPSKGVGRKKSVLIE